MPIYEYRCEKCGHRIELIQKLSDPPITVCTECGGSMTKMLAASALQFKGSGWYITDYSDKGKPPKTEPKKDSPEKPPAESKPTPPAGTQTPKTD